LEQKGSSWPRRGSEGEYWSVRLAASPSRPATWPQRGSVKAYPVRGRRRRPTFRAHSGRGSGRIGAITSALVLCLALAFLVLPYLPIADLGAGPVRAAPPAVQPVEVPEPDPADVGQPAAVPATPPSGVSRFVPPESLSTSAAPGPSLDVWRHADLPVRLRIPAIDVDAPIVSLGLLAGGELAAPSLAGDVGWFKLGVKPGEAGNALLDGHLDWYRAVGVFYYLGKLTPGDTVSVVDAAGTEHTFRVVWKELVPVDKAPMERIVGQTPVPAVTLITCGGQWNSAAKEYTHRWVVRAVAMLPPAWRGQAVRAY
jgi:sortase (surface protein transpeptidase)